jgi:hypothetical protein
MQTPARPFAQHPRHWNLLQTKNHDVEVSLRGVLRVFGRPVRNLQ